MNNKIFTLTWCVVYQQFQVLLLEISACTWLLLPKYMFRCIVIVEDCTRHLSMSNPEFHYLNMPFNYGINLQRKRLQIHRENKRITEDKICTQHNRYHKYKWVVIIKRCIYAKAVYTHVDNTALGWRNHCSSIHLHLQTYGNNCLEHAILTF